jgi:hypothetical protein
VTRTQGKIRADLKAAGIEDDFNIMAEPLFTKSAETIFRMGRRGGGQPGLKAIGGIEDLTRNLKDIQLGVSIAGFQPQALKQLDPNVIKNRIKSIPSGEPFSNMEEYIKTKADAYKIVRIRNLYLNILSQMELASRLDPGKVTDIPGKVGGAFDRAQQAIGTNTGNYQSIVGQ